MKNGNIIFLLLVLGLFSNCEKEVIKEVEIERITSWQADSHFQFNYKTQKNSLVVGEELYLLSMAAMHRLTTIPGDTNLRVLNYSLRFEYLSPYRMPISSRLFGGFGEKRLIFTSMEMPVSSGTTFNLSMKEVDPEFASFSFPSATFSDAYAINENQVILVPYSIYLPGSNQTVIQGNFPRFALVQASVDEFEQVDTLSTSFITPIDDLLGVLKIQSLRDDFLVSAISGTYRITEDGVITKVLDDPLYDFIPLEGQLYGLSRSFLYRSTDDGLSWQTISTISPDFVLLNYEVIDDVVIGHYLDQLYQLKFTDTNLETVELQNEGLEGHQITSVARWNGKAYISTLSGVFTRDWQEVLEPL